METSRYDAPTAEEQRDDERRELDRLFAERAAEEQRHAEAYYELQRVRRILRAFVLAPISASSLQPVFDLAHQLNPSVREELDALVNNPFSTPHPPCPHCGSVGIHKERCRTHGSYLAPPR